MNELLNEKGFIQKGQIFVKEVVSSNIHNMKIVIKICLYKDIWQATVDGYFGNSFSNYCGTEYFEYKTLKNVFKKLEKEYVGYAI